MNTLSTTRRFATKSFWLLSLILTFSHFSFAQTPFIMQVSGNNCVGGGQIFVLQGVSSCSSINWSATGSPSITVLGNQTVQMIWNTPQSSATVTASYSYCSTGGSGSKNLYYVQINQPVTPTISLPTTGNYEVCNSGGNVSFSASASGTGSYPSYSWYVNNNLNKNTTSSSTSITVAPGDQVKVTMYSDAPCANPTSVSSNIITIQEKDIPTPSENAIFPSAVYCGSETGAQVVVVSATAGYEHILRSSSEVFLESAFPDNYNRVIFDYYPEGIYKVYVVNDCNEEVHVGSITITRNPNPGGTATPSRGLSQSFCDGDPGVLTITAGVGSSFKWYIDNSPTPYSTNKTLSYPFSHESYGTPGSHTVSLSYNVTNSCGTSVPVQVSGMPVNIDYAFNPTVSIQPLPPAICPGESVTLTANPSDAGTNPDYLWTVGSETFTNRSFDYVVNEDVNISVQLTSNESCFVTDAVDNESTSISIKDTSIPNLGYVANDSFCQDEEGGQIVIQGATPGYSYKLYNSSNQYLKTAIATEDNMVFFQYYPEGVYTVNVVNICNREIEVGTSELIEYEIPEGGTAIPDAAITNPFCETNPGTLKIVAGSGSEYRWYIDDDLVLSDQQTFYYPFANNYYGVPGSYQVKLKYTISNPCRSDIPLAVNNLPEVVIIPEKVASVSISTNANFPVCNGSLIRFNAVISPLEMSQYYDYSWRIVNIQEGKNEFYQNNQNYFESDAFDNGDVITCEINLKAGFTTAELCLEDDFYESNAKSISYKYKPNAPAVSGFQNNCGETEMSISAVSLTTQTRTSIVHTWYDSNDNIISEGVFSDADLGSGVFQTIWQNTFVNGKTYYVTATNECNNTPESIKKTTFTINTGSIPHVSVNAYTCNPNNQVASPLQLTFLGAPQGSSYEIFRKEIYYDGTQNDVPMATANTETYTYDDFYLGYINNVYVKLLDPYNCPQDIIQHVFIEPIMVTPPYVEGPDVACYGTDVTLIASNGVDNIYNWYDDQGTFLESTSQLSLANLTDDITVSVTQINNGYLGSCESNASSHTVNVSSEITEVPTVFGSSQNCGYGTFIAKVSGDFSEYHWRDLSNDNVVVTKNLSYTLDESNQTKSFAVKGVKYANCESDEVMFNVRATQNCENYIHETIVTETGHSPTDDLALIDIDYKDDNWTYFDGLGRNMQTIFQQSTPNENDLVQPVIYDDYGREIKSYLPFSQTNVADGLYKLNPVASEQETDEYHTSAQYQFYDNLFGGAVTGIKYPFGQKNLEPSPLGRVLEEAAPGEYWHFGAVDDEGNITNAQTAYQYITNSAGEVRLWEIDFEQLVDNQFRKLTSDNFYSQRELTLNVITDENGSMTCEYKDKQGKIVLKKSQLSSFAQISDHDGWACTYYIYDDFGNLRYVIPPQAVQEMVDAADWTLVENPDFIDNWLFYYDYDERQRMGIKKVPGAEPVYLVYDYRDRIILTQDGNQRSMVFGDNTGKQWIFTKYDALNRPIMTGIYTHNGPEITQADMQHDVVDVEIASGTDFYEEYNGTSANHGYTNRMFPTTNAEVLSVTYYDNYAFKGQSWFDEENLNYDYNNSLNPALQPAAENTLVTGQVTGSKVKVLHPDGGVQYLNSVTYYDDRYRVIQVIAENHLGSTETTTSCYGVDDLSENVEESFMTSTMSDAPNVHRRFHYDAASRLTSIEHSIDGEPFVVITSNEYNELGELIKKELHQEGGNPRWQSVDYKYNIRGWLTNINDANLDSEPDDLFGMELYYASGFKEVSFNGNISGVKWKSVVDEDRMAYGYTYDRLNRIRSAHYVAGENNNWKDEGYYNLEIHGARLSLDDYESWYDLNGNIKKLKRYGVADNHQAAIDVLSYDYTGSGNQLNKVDDDGTNEGFRDGTVDINSDGLDYLYDANGNMIADDNKEIENIDYNFLNLPMVIDMTDGRKIEYVYDAAGVKLAQRVFEDETKPVTKVTDYIGERVYEAIAGGSRELQFLHHEEGRIVPGPQLDDPNWTSDAPDWEYQYHLKDHLGNTRLTFGAPTEDVFTLTMEVVEPENRIIEDREFENVTISEDNRLPDHNHTPVVAGVTPDPEYVVKLDGITKVIGPAKSFKVLPGDEINIDVWAKYLHAESYNPSVAAEALLGGFFEAFINYSSEMLISKGYVNGPLLTGLENIPTGKNHDGVPEAYINYIVFDKNYEVVNGESKKLRISDEGKYGDGSLGTHEHLVVPTINITKAGYIYIYLSNHTPVSEVIFDDLTIKHTKSRVIQKNDYYPFGLSIAGLSTQRENSLKNKWTFQGQEVQDDFDLGWYGFKYRNHQPEIGRFFNIDPLADKYVYNSTYAFSENRVTGHIELEGLEAINFAPFFGLTKALTEMKKDDPSFRDYIKTGLGLIVGGTQMGQGFNNMIEGTTRSAKAQVELSTNGGKIIQKAIESGENPNDALTALDEEITQGKIQIGVGAVQVTTSASLSQLSLYQGAMMVPTSMSSANYGTPLGKQIKVYRVFGGDSRAQGFSWTTTEPTTVSNFRNVAGLPSGGASGYNNTADFMVEGNVNVSDIIKTRPAIPLDGNAGGLPEYIIDPQNVCITDFSVLKP